MNINELTLLVEEGESERMEFKLTTDLSSPERKAELAVTVAKTVCAMLNGLGGFVIFGVRNNHELIGQKIRQDSIEDIRQQLSGIWPPAFPAVEIITVTDRRSFIVLKVAGSTRLYDFDGRFYMRVGPTTQLMPHHKLVRRLMKIYCGWRFVPTSVGFAKADLTELRLALGKAIDIGLLRVLENGDIQIVMYGLDLFLNGQNYIFLRYGAGWLLAFDGFPEGNWTHLKGLERIHRLLQNSGTDIDVVELAQDGLDGADIEKNKATASEILIQQTTKGLTDGAKPKFAAKKLRLKRDLLNRKIDDAKDRLGVSSDRGERDELEDDLRKWMEELAPIEDKLNSPDLKRSKNANDAVRKSIFLESIPEMTKRLPKMAEHLNNSIQHENAKYSYIPTTNINWLLKHP